MRVDGSFSNLTSGVTTLDSKRQPGTFAEQLDNFQCVPEEGLVRRPALDWRGGWGDIYTKPTAVSFHAFLRNEPYWISIEPGDGVESVRCWAMHAHTGERIDIDHTAAGIITYFNTIESLDDIAWTVIDDIIYIANKKVTVSQINVPSERNRTSMIVVKQAPKAFSTISVKWTQSDGVIREISYDVPSDESLATSAGTNKVATEIAILMDALSGFDNVYVEGSTVAYEFDGERDFCYAVTEDGANGSAVVAVNNETDSLDNLPKYAPDKAIVRIRPDKDSDRGQFWMRADKYITYGNDDGPSRPADHVLVSGVTDYPNGLRSAGFFNDFGIGSITPNTLSIFGSEIRTCVVQYDLNLGNMYGELIIYDDGAQTPPNPTQFVVLQQGTGYALIDAPLIQVNKTTWQTARITPPQFLENDTAYHVYLAPVDNISPPLPEVRWTECADPNSDNGIDPTTMPMVLGYGIGDNQDDLFLAPMGNSVIDKQFGIRNREAGNSESNPMPDFVNSTITDLGRYQSRLVVLSNESVDMSVTNKPHAWFRESATQQLANDPISMKSSSPDSMKLNSLVHHNNDLLIFSQNVQFKVVGGVAMTSQNASMAQTTQYTNAPTARPINDGSNVYFPTQHDKTYSGVSIYGVDPEADVQDEALSLTQHVRKFIKGTIKFLTGSTLHSMVAVVTDQDPNILYVLEYDKRTQPPQTAWSRWIIPEFTYIEGFHFYQYGLYVLTRNNNDQAANVIFMDRDKLDMASYNTPDTRTVGLAKKYLHYDRRILMRATSSIVTYPSGYHMAGNVRIFYGDNGDASDGREIAWSFGTGSQIILAEDATGKDIVFGIPFESTYVPAQKWIRDDAGVAQTYSKISITDYKVAIKADLMEADIVPRTGTTEQWPTQTYLNEVSEIETIRREEDKFWRISFKQRPQDAQLKLSTTSAYAASISQIEWRGVYSKEGKRI